MSILRLMTYNVRYFGHGTRGVMSTYAGLRRIAASVARMDRPLDVVCLQEVEARSLRSSLVTLRARGSSAGRGATMLEVLQEELDVALRRAGKPWRYGGTYFPAHRYRLMGRFDLYTTGLAMLVRAPIVATAHQLAADITHRRGVRRLKQTRICAHMTLEVPATGRGNHGHDGATLDLFNTHMSLPGPFYPEFWTRRERLGFGPNQLVEARRLVEAINAARRGQHVVLVGDFNSLPGSPVDRLLKNEAGLVDALAAANGLTGERLRAWSTAGFMKKRMNIDRIYSSPQVRWLDFEGSRPFDGRDGLSNRFAGLSDHVPLVGTLQLSAG